MKELKRKFIPAVIATILLLAGCTDTSQSPASPSSPGSDSQPKVLTPKEADGEISLDRNFYLIIDDSGSMDGRDYGTSRIEAARLALEEFATKVVLSDVNIGLYTLNQGELVPLGKQNRDAIVQKIRGIRTGGGTPLNNAIRRGTDALTKQREKQLGYGEFYLVVATDGEATDGPMDASSGGIVYARENGIPIITIGIGIKNHPLRNQSLSYREAANQQELLQALKETQGESDYFDSTVFQK